MTPQDRGRLDYRPKPGQPPWVVVEYRGRKDVELGRYPSRQEAAEALQAAVRTQARRG